MYFLINEDTEKWIFFPIMALDYVTLCKRCFSLGFGDNYAVTVSHSTSNLLLDPCTNAEPNLAKSNSVQSGLHEWR